MKGVLVTCNEKEKNCVREAYNVLNEVNIYSNNIIFYDSIVFYGIFFWVYSTVLVIIKQLLKEEINLPSLQESFSALHSGS